MQVPRVIRTQRTLIVALAMFLVLTGTFSTNLLGTADSNFFTAFDRESQSLVLAKIEQQKINPGAEPWGLVVASPDILSPYKTIDSLNSGARPEAASYLPYRSQLGLQGYAFSALYKIGCSSKRCLNVVEAGAFSGVLLLFAFLLAAVTRRSVALVFLATCITSPWVVAAARNLYWVPWTWLLPACSAAWFVLARRPRTRVAAGAVLVATMALRAGSGYEFVTCVILLAASMPVFGKLLRVGPAWRTVAKHVATIVALCLLGFLAILIVHALEAGNGSIAQGIQVIVDDATKRTYGTAHEGMDPVTVISLSVSPVKVVAIYLIRWQTNVLALSPGHLFTVALGPLSFAVLLLVAAVLVVLDVRRKRLRWRRNTALLAVAIVTPMSWFVLAKSHSYTDTQVNYVLWYLIFVPILLWVIGDAVASTAPVTRLRATLAGRLRAAL